MNSLSRLESKNIQWGKSYVLGADAEQAKKQKALDEAEIIIQKAKDEAAKILAEANSKQESLLAATNEECKKIKQEAEAIKLEANNIIEAAKSEADAIREKYKTEGIKLGRQDGEEQIRKELAEQILMVDKFTKSYFDVKKRIIKSAYIDIIELVVGIVQKLGMEVLLKDSTFLQQSVIRAINLLPEKEFVTILINPQLAERIYALTPELKSKIVMLKNIKIVEDSAVAAEGPIVESVHTRLDARLSSQLETIKTELTEHLNSINENELVEITDKELANENHK